jgi:hypothetical protein
MNHLCDDCTSGWHHRCVGAPCDCDCPVWPIDALETEMRACLTRLARLQHEMARTDAFVESLDGTRPEKGKTDVYWVVWSFERQAWRTGHHRYTPDLAQAALYTLPDARALIDYANRETETETTVRLMDAARDGIAAVESIWPGHRP